MGTEDGGKGKEGRGRGAGLFRRPEVFDRRQMDQPREEGYRAISGEDQLLRCGVLLDPIIGKKRKEKRIFCPYIWDDIAISEG